MKTLAGTSGGLAALAMLAAAEMAATAAPPPLPRAVILFIGDGMGTGQVAAARAFAGRPLVFETWPSHTRVATGSANNPVTDSAAAATAMATGRKVDNGVIGSALPGDGAALETLAELAHRQGRRFGLVTTTFVTHATPAAFGAHTGSREDYAVIGMHYLTNSQPDVMLGGGEIGLTAAACAAAGYTVVTGRTDLLAQDPATTARLAGFFGSSMLPYEVDGLAGGPSLAEMTRVALRMLNADPDGFFLMVEGGRIDHAGHANDLARNIGETLGFEAAVNEALTWAADRPDTLAIVTADHETGGLQVLADRGAGQYPDVQWTTTGHTSTPVPLYAWGRGAGRLQWITDNTEVHDYLSAPQWPAPRVLRAGPAPAGGMTFDWIASSGRVYRCETATALAGGWSPGPLVTGTTDAVQSAEITGDAAGAVFLRMTDAD